MLYGFTFNNSCPGSDPTRGWLHIYAFIGCSESRWSVPEMFVLIVNLVSGSINTYMMARRKLIQTDRPNPTMPLRI